MAELCFSQKQTTTPTLFEATNGMSEKLYFYGHKISLLAEIDFFRRLAGGYRRLGLCFMTSALAMMLLKDNPTAKLVIARIGEDDFYDPINEIISTPTHRYVKFQWNEKPFVLDFNWIGGNPVAMSDFETYQVQRHNLLTTIREYSWSEFWALTFPENYMARLREPQTSYIFLDMLRAFSYDPNYENGEFMYGETIGNRSMLIREDRYGKVMKFINPEAIEDENNHKGFFRVYSRRIFNEMVAKPKRMHPKAHTVRRTKSIVLSWY